MKVGFDRLNFNGHPFKKPEKLITAPVLQTAGDKFISTNNSSPKTIKQAFSPIKALLFKTQIEDAKEGFHKYQHMSFLINHALRHNPNSLNEAYQRTGEEYYRIAQHFIDRGFDLISEKLAEDTKVYRVVFQNEEYPAKWNIGDIIDEKAFTSTSYFKDTRFLDLWKNQYKKNHKESMPIDIEILLPKGTKVIKEDGPMKEVLIRHHSRFKVVDYNPDTNTYVWQFLGGFSEK